MRLRLWLATGAFGLALLAAVLVFVFFGRAPTAAPRVVVPTPRPTVEPLVQVHVAGAVQAPGVYRLPASARVADAIAAAGGVTADGDAQALNLAARVQDGQKLTVPRVAPTAGPAASASESSATPVAPSPASRKVNLNTADAAQLEALPGIGPVTARRIIEWRQQHGPFTGVEQLREQKLVNASTYERVKELVTVE